MALAGVEDFSSSPNQLLCGYSQNAAFIGDSRSIKSDDGVVGRFFFHPIRGPPLIKRTGRTTAHQCDDDEPLVCVFSCLLCQSGCARGAPTSTKSCVFKQDDVVAKIVKADRFTELVRERVVFNDGSHSEVASGVQVVTA